MCRIVLKDSALLGLDRPNVSVQAMLYNAYKEKRSTFEFCARARKRKNGLEFFEVYDFSVQ